jgi:adenosylmethionine-8-amino-7-oxononanoate aminotransferase
VQRIIRTEGLVENVAAMGRLLSQRLKELLHDHPNVADIRGRGLFWGIEFVADKVTKAPFPSTDSVALNLSELGLEEPYLIAVYPCSGTANGVDGDHIIIAPPYNTTAAEVEKIAMTVYRLVTRFFLSKP